MPGKRQTLRRTFGDRMAADDRSPRKAPGRSVEPTCTECLSENRVLADLRTAPSAATADISTGFSDGALVEPSCVVPLLDEDTLPSEILAVAAKYLNLYLGHHTQLFFKTQCYAEPASHRQS